MATLKGSKYAESRFEAMRLLVAGQKLQRADILVTRSKGLLGSLLGRAIRFGTYSAWNHAAMVYVIAGSDQGYDDTFIIESGGGGIDIHNIKNYFEHPEKNDVGIIRLEEEWFDTDISRSLDYRRRIRGFALEEIDDKYDYSRIGRLAKKFARQIFLFAFYSWLGITKPAKKHLMNPKLPLNLDVHAYICSGFVKWSYIVAAFQALSQQQRTSFNDIIFNPEVSADPATTTSLDSISPLKELLLSTTPADIANHVSKPGSKLRWKWVIKNGAVSEVGENGLINGMPVDEFMRK